MREHPIPQDITGYRFHIIGNMTLKQFAEILLGVMLGFLFYKLNLPDFVRYPLALLCLITGFAAAFVPIEEQPLDHWIITFFKTLYKPTKFYWRKKPKIPDAFKHETQKDAVTPTQEFDTSHIRRDRIEQFLESVQQPVVKTDEFDLAQDQQANLILQTFDQIQVPSNPTKQAVKPNLKVRARKMGAIPQASIIYQAQPKNIQTPTTNSQPELATTSTKNTNQKTKTVINNPEPVRQVPALPFPNQPTKPNIIVGMLLNGNKELISNATIELKNSAGQTMIVVQSNALGQFIISEQLQNGDYTIEVIKDGYEFSPYAISLSGEVVKPLEIHSN